MPPGARSLLTLRFLERAYVSGHDMPHCRASLSRRGRRGGQNTRENMRDAVTPELLLARSLLTLRYIEARLYLDPIRECYEAFVIYNFYMFLIAYLEVGAAGYSVSLKGFPAAEKQKHYSEDESVTTMP